MKRRWLTSGGILLGLLLGLLCGPLFPAAFSTSSAGAGPSTNPDPTTGDSGVNRSSSRDKPSDRKPTRPRIAIPMSEVAKLVKNRLGGNASWCGISSNSMPSYRPEVFAETLTLLDATDTERENVNAVFQKVFDRLQQAEASHVKIASVTPDTVVLDLSEMMEATKAIAAQAREELAQALPDARGQLLQESIDWDKIYSAGPEAKSMLEKPPTIRFQVRWDGDNLTAWAQSSDGHGSGGNSLNKRFPDPTLPIPAGQLFSRWQPQLAGISFTPPEKKE